MGVSRPAHPDDRTVPRPDPRRLRAGLDARPRPVLACPARADTGREARHEREVKVRTTLQTQIGITDDAQLVVEILDEKEVLNGVITPIILTRAQTLEMAVVILKAREAEAPGFIERTLGAMTVEKRDPPDPHPPERRADVGAVCGSALNLLRRLRERCAQEADYEAVAAGYRVQDGCPAVWTAKHIRQIDVEDWVSAGCPDREKFK